MLCLRIDKYQLSLKENYRPYSQLADMEKLIFFTWTVTVLLSLFSAKQSSGSFFSSLQFTRDALMDFSRGSQRTVDITLEPKKTIEVVNK